MRSKLYDPLIDQPEPITLLIPVIENLLKQNKIKTSRKEIIKRFQNRVKRICVVTGSTDHPAHLYDTKIIPVLVTELWRKGALPFVFQIPAICDGIAQGHAGMQFSLKSRNLTVELVSSQILAHHYDAGIFLSGCDKNPAGFLGGSILVDRVYQRYYKKSFHAIFLNTPVMQSRLISKKLKLLLPDNSRLKALYKESLKCNVYVKYHKILNELEQERKISSKKKREFLDQLSTVVCPTGGTCSFMGTGSTAKFILYTLGLVPDDFFLPLKCEYINPSNIKKAIQPLFHIVNKDLSSVSQIVKDNFQNALKIHGAINGSLNWIIHFKFLADLIEYKQDIIKKVNNVPLVYNEKFNTVTLSKQNLHFSMIKTLLDLNILQDKPTIAGLWKQRLKKYKPLKINKNNRSHFLRFSGNLFSRVVIKLTHDEFDKLKQFHNKVFQVSLFFSEEDFNNRIMKKKQGLLKKIPKKILNLFNQKESLTAVFLLAQGFNTRGMPEMYYPSEYINQDTELKNRTILITDGRYSGATYGFSFGYMEPEWQKESKLNNLKNEDLILFDFKNRLINLLDKELLYKKGKVKIKKIHSQINNREIESPINYIRDHLK